MGYTFFADLTLNRVITQNMLTCWRYDNGFNEGKPPCQAIGQSNYMHLGVSSFICFRDWRSAWNAHLWYECWYDRYSTANTDDHTTKMLFPGTANFTGNILQTITLLILGCIRETSVRVLGLKVLWVHIYRGYPAKRALPAMLTHGR